MGLRWECKCGSFHRAILTLSFNVSLLFFFYQWPRSPTMWKAGSGNWNRVSKHFKLYDPLNYRAFPLSFRISSLVEACMGWVTRTIFCIKKENCNEFYRSTSSTLCLLSLILFPLPACQYQIPQTPLSHPMLTTLQRCVWVSPMCVHPYSLASGWPERGSQSLMGCWLSLLPDASRLLDGCQSTHFTSAPWPVEDDKWWGVWLRV